MPGRVAPTKSYARTPWSVLDWCTGGMWSRSAVPHGQGWWTGWSAYGLFRAHRYMLKWTELNKGAGLVCGWNGGLVLQSTTDKGEGRGGAHMGFSKRIDTMLNWTQQGCWFGVRVECWSRGAVPQTRVLVWCTGGVLITWCCPRQTGASVIVVVVVIGMVANYHWWCCGYGCLSHCLSVWLSLFLGHPAGSRRGCWPLIACADCCPPPSWPLLTQPHSLNPEL